MLMPNKSVRLLMVGILIACQAAAWEMPESWTTKITPVKVADDFYYVGSADLAAYLLVSDAGHVLIDAPLKEFAPALLDNVRELGFDPADIRHVVPTHGHFDHVGGLTSVLDATGATLIASARAAELIARGGGGDFLLGNTATYPPVAVDQVIEHGEWVNVDGSATWSLQAVVTPGHTRGCTSWRGTARLNGREVTWVLSCSLSVLPGYKLHGIDESYPDIGADFCTSLARLDALSAELFLVNHGLFFDFVAKSAQIHDDSEAFVDAEGYRAYLATARDKIDKARIADGGSACPR